VTDQPKIRRGIQHAATVVAVSMRHYSEPIPDEFLPQFEAAGIVVDDNDHDVIFYRAGRKVGAVFGPSVSGGWFAYRDPTGVINVDDRDAGLRHVLTIDAPDETAVAR
jgi:hypothetical protein